MSKKYRLMICDCGRIHLISNDQIIKSFDDNKDIMIICGGCGKVTIIGADQDCDWIAENTYYPYTHELSREKSKVITADAFKGTKGQKAISKIIYDAGIQVPMMTGRYATSYSDGIFYDDREPDLDEIYRADINFDKVHAFISKHKLNMITVDMTKLIKESPAELIKELSSYYIVGLNWDVNAETELHHKSS